MVGGGLGGGLALRPRPLSPCGGEGRILCLVVGGGSGGGLALRPRSLSPDGGEGWILWLVVCPGRFGPLAPALLALRGRGVEVCDQKNWEES